MLGVAQLCSGPDRARNVLLCADAMRAAKEKGVELLCLPEAFDYINDIQAGPPNWHEYAAPKRTQYTGKTNDQFLLVFLNQI
jgi:predicted amidohydrolase